MDSLSLKFACGYSGKCTGVSGSPNLATTVGRVARCTVTGANKQVYAKQITVSGGATTTLDLTTGLTNPLNESINGSLDFAKVLGVFIEHDAASISSGITVMGGGSDDFQGPLAAGDKPTLAPGEWFAFGMPASSTGWTVDGTHKNIAIVNNDGTDAATVNVFILGTTT